MKFLTTNFVKCAVKSCSASDDSFPLEYKDCELILVSQEFDANFIVHMLDKLNWEAILKVAKDLGNESLPSTKPELDAISEDDQAIIRELHGLLVETNITEGKMVCRNCDHIYYIKNSIPNFLLPPHLAN